jgi:hypothetical protein
MSKGAILDESLVHALGLSEQLLTLTGPIENRHHPVLQEPMFVIHAEEIAEPVHLERKYVFDNQVSIKGSYGKGDKVLAWLARSLKPNPHDTHAAQVEVLVARDFFLLGDWREFQRFKQFIKSMRIIDAQARQWLTDHHGELEVLSGTAEGLARIIGVLGRIAEWPELEGGATTRATSLEGVAKTFSKGLLHVREAPLFPTLLLRLEPDMRFSVFRIMGFVEDPAHGAAGLIAFLLAMAKATREPEVVESAAVLKSSRDLSRVFASLRKYLLSSKIPHVPT